MYREVALLLIASQISLFANRLLISSGQATDMGMEFAVMKVFPH